ncbi:MAG: hypothetical protein EOO20_14260 [Chryseobacterium sp.]|nr:MAG: hypothetical protein EOO20_14260 [Chryseobacterium sp.]
MARLDKQRQTEKEPMRINFAKTQLEKRGFDVQVIEGNKLTFIFKGNKIQLFPYSGWHSGKGIKAGRGLMELINQLK